MKYSFKIILVIIGILAVVYIGYRVVLGSRSNNNQVGGVNSLNMSTDSERQACLNVLTQYAPKHPMDLKCSLHIDEGGDTAYYFLDPATGDVLKVDVTLHTSVLTDKDGKVLSSN